MFFQTQIEIGQFYRLRKETCAMAAPPDYYEALQVSPNAELEVIQAAYKRLAYKWHPDRSPGDPSAAERMKLLNEAYEVLSDPHKRRVYDEQRGGPTTNGVTVEEPSQATAGAPRDRPPFGPRPPHDSSPQTETDKHRGMVSPRCG